MIDTQIGNKYNIDGLLGNGKFGVVYLGVNLKSGEKVAIKTENANSKYKVLKHEVTVLNYLYGNGVRTIPSVYWYGVHLEYRCIVMSYYSNSLQDYFDKKGPVPANTLGSLMIKCINILDNIHRYYVLHRDIKPQNFMIRDGELYIIDFGLSTYYVDGDGEHIEKSDKENIIGSPRYISFHNHCGEPLSRRDDLISLGYMYMFLSVGKLPWDAIANSGSDAIANSGSDAIQSTSVLHPMNINRRSLKTWSNIKGIVDGAIRRYMKYCYGLKYDEEPDYQILMELFVL